MTRLPGPLVMPSPARPGVTAPRPLRRGRRGWERRRCSRQAGRVRGRRVAHLRAYVGGVPGRRTPLHRARAGRRQRRRVQGALVGHEADRAPGGARDVEADGDGGAGADGQPLTDARVTGAAPGDAEGERHGGGLGEVGAAGADAVEDRLPGQVVGQDHRLRQADELRLAVGVTAADRRRPAPAAPGGERAVPGRERDLVVGGVRPVPHLHRVRLPEPELPVAPDAGGVRMRGYDEAARAADLTGVVAEAVVTGAVAPVDEGAGVGADGDDMPVTGGDFLAGEDQQLAVGVRPPQPLPGTVRGMGVVLTRVDEVEPRRTGRRGDLGRGAPPVGVHGMQVAVAPVPGAAPPHGALRRVDGGRGAAGRAVPERDGDGVRKPPGGGRVRTQHDVPGPRAHRTGDVPGRRGVGAEEELRPGPARPAAEAAPAQAGAALVEDADVEGVALRAGGHRRSLVRVRDGDLPYSARHFDGQVDVVGRPRRECAAYGPGLLAAGGRGIREAHAAQGEGGGGAGHEQSAARRSSRRTRHVGLSQGYPRVLTP